MFSGIMPSSGNLLKNARIPVTEETLKPVTGGNKCSQPYLYKSRSNTHTGTRFMADTGSAVSIIPLTLSKNQYPPDKLTLTAEWLQKIFMQPRKV